MEALKIRTQQAAEVAFGNETDALDTLAASIYTDGYYHTAFEIQRGLGVGWDIGTIDQDKLQKLLQKPWTSDKMTFSDRIWKSKVQLLDSVSTELTQMCILGKSPDQAIANISKRMNVSKHQAGRLVMTESAYFASAAQKDCFNDLDVEEFEIVATLDSRTSEICQEMDGQHFPMKDFEAGITAPPFHVYCRSTTVPYFDNEFTADETRAARGEDGKTYQVPASMKYPEWKEKYIKDAVSEQDKKLYEKYKGMLGKNAPKSIEDFISIRYNNTDWNMFKSYTKAINSGELTTLTDFDLYKNTSKQMDDKLLGVITSNGITITGKSKHSIARVIGSVTQKRSGVSVDDILNTLTNKTTEISTIKVLRNGRSQKFKNTNVEVSINPDTGNIIQVNPRHTRKKVKS